MTSQWSENVYASTWKMIYNSLGIYFSHGDIQGRSCLNSLRPSDAYMRRWTGPSSVQIMACRLFGAKPLCWNIVDRAFRNKLQWNFNRNSNIFIHEIAFENRVCEMASILSRPQCVKLVYPILMNQTDGGAFQYLILRLFRSREVLRPRHKEFKFSFEITSELFSSSAAQTPAKLT